METELFERVLNLGFDQIHARTDQGARDFFPIILAYAPYRFEFTAVIGRVDRKNRPLPGRSKEKVTLQSVPRWLGPIQINSFQQRSSVALIPDISQKLLVAHCRLVRWCPSDIMISGYHNNLIGWRPNVI